MRDQTKGGNLYYIELFVADKKDFEFVYSVGIDLITNQYMTEYSKYIEHSFVAYSENTYQIIDTKSFMTLLEQALSKHFISEQNYTELKQYDEPNLHVTKDLTSRYEKIAQKTIAKEKKIICIPDSLNIKEKHLYKHYHNFLDQNDFVCLYFNRYSQNNGWCIRLIQNEIGYKLVVIYSENPIPDLFHEKEYIAFTKRYFSDALFYLSHSVYERQLTDWETNYLIHLLEEEHFYERLAPKMKLHKEEHIGYTGECQIKVQYRSSVSHSEQEPEINGYTSNDSKTTCGVDFFRLIQKFQSLAEHGSKLIVDKMS